MTAQNIITQMTTFAKSNSPGILTAFGISGTVTTAYLAATAGYKSAELLKENEEDIYLSKNPNQEKFKVVWRLYVPTVISGATTISCLVLATRINYRKTAAITAAYSISEKAFSEYKEKVVETIGKNKEQKLKDEIVQNTINKNPTGQVIIAGSGPVLCCDLFTGRYFNSDMETLRKAQNDVNAYLVRHDKAAMSYFYDLIGLPHTTYSWDVGWTSDRFLELSFSTVLSEDNKPCIAFDFNYTKPI